MLLDILAKASLAPLRLLPLLALAVALTLPLDAAFAEEGLLEGQLRNGTVGAAVPGELDVTLMSIDQNGVPQPVQQAKTDARGAFRFSGIDTAETARYVVSAKYNDVTYWSALIAGSTPQKPADLIVYETTDDSAAIGIDLAHSILEAGPDGKSLWVIEVLVISNGGDRTYTGDPSASGDDKPSTLFFSLPPGATHLQPMQGVDPDAMVELPNGFADTAPVQPGSQTIAYSYLLPSAGSAMTFVRTMDYPTERFVALVPESIGNVDSALSKGQPAEIGGQRYQQYVAEKRKAGATVSVSFGAERVLPWLPFDKKTSAGIAAAIVVVAGGGAFVWRRRRSQTEDYEADEYEDEEVAGDERDALLAELAELENAYETGDMDEREYTQASAAHRRRLAEMNEEEDQGPEDRR